MPLENLSGDPSQEYFSDGMTEMLVTELGKINDLTVIPRSSANRFKNTRTELTQIARELNVDAIIVGSTARFGGRARITLQFHDGRSGKNIWSETYESEGGEAMVLQGKIARSIADEIKVKLSRAEQASLASGRRVDPAAEDAYLNGLYFWGQARDASGGKKRVELYKKGAALFERAIEIEPTYGRAYSKAARCYNALGKSGRL